MISILFVAKNSVYKTMSDSAGEPLDCWDEERDAMKWPGGNPIVAHPPCRLFSMWRLFSTAPVTEKALAFWAIGKVRRWGGVLEHPAFSKLYEERGLPRPGRRDEYGFTYGLDQWVFGHKCRKRTWLYICGISPKDLPEVPLKLGEAELSLASRRSCTNQAEKDFRSVTPPAFARWLVETAERCHALTDKGN